MGSRRRGYTYSEAHTTLTAWLKRERMSQADFIKWLDSRGVTVSRATCSLLVTGQLTPGPRFKSVFKEITGIVLVDGLVERTDLASRRP